jgi:hypothetical protein
LEVRVLHGPLEKPRAGGVFAFLRMRPAMEALADEQPSLVLVVRTSTVV